MTRLTITPQGNSYRVYNHEAKKAHYVDDIEGIDIHDDTRQLELEVDRYMVDSEENVISLNDS